MIMTLHNVMYNNQVANMLSYNRLFMQLRNLRLAKKRLYADFIYAQLYMGCDYPTVDINSVN